MKVAAGAPLAFSFQADRNAKLLQKNLIVLCGDVYSYHDFTCTDSNLCEVKIVHHF